MTGEEAYMAWCAAARVPRFNRRGFLMPAPKPPKAWGNLCGRSRRAWDAVADLANRRGAA